jgi:HK97 gp10 family phage protein
VLSFDVSELNRLAADMGKAGGAVGAKTARVVEGTAVRVEADAKAFAPVDTGNLRASIGHEVTGDGRNSVIEAEIFATASYAVWVEGGTSRMAPRAFLGPALDRNTPGFVEAMEQVVDL